MIVGSRTNYIPRKVGYLYFESKEEARKFFMNLINYYSEYSGRAKIAKNGLNHQRVSDLFKLHPRYEEKLGVGVDYFFVDWSGADRPGKPTRCFWVKRLDGSEEAFSVLKCLKMVKC